MIIPTYRFYNLIVEGAALGEQLIRDILGMGTVAEASSGTFSRADAIH
ncbi:hypothetical protein ACWGTI_26885 [Mesorhizobium sp. ArgA1]